MQTGIFCLILPLLVQKSGSILQSPREDIYWTHQLSLSGDFQLKWTAEDPEWLTVEISTTGKGYLGIGITPHGGMAGSDIALGWVDPDGVTHFKDYHGIKNGAPVEDPRQDYELIYAIENEDGTKIVFRRKWDTCDDKHDIPIGNEPVRVIWAWHPFDPYSKLHLPAHEPRHRGVRSINFKRPEGNGFPKFPDDPGYAAGSRDNESVFWDAKMYNVHVPRAETYHHCQIFKWPRLEKKYHVIGYRPIIEGDHAKSIRHISLHICQVPKAYGRTQDYFERYLLDFAGKGCYHPDTPKDWIQFCVISQAAYSIEKNGSMYPSHVGMPIGDIPDEPVYVRLEVQYENQDGVEFLDSSGLRIFYTSKLRRYDAGMLLVGHRRTPFLTIPPFQTSFQVSGLCSADCTRMGVRSGGTRIFSVLLNSHQSGRKMTLRHIREGKELAPLAQDVTYDFKYQEFLEHTKEVLFLPGDDLILECDYQTIDKNVYSLVRKDKTIFENMLIGYDVIDSENFKGGPSFNTELCEAVILYYPKSALADCRSQPEFYNYLKAFGVRNATGNWIQHLSFSTNQQFNTWDTEAPNLAVADDSDIIFLEHPTMTMEDLFDKLVITAPPQFAGLTWLKYLHGLVWTNHEFIGHMENQWRFGLRNIFCASNDGKRIRLRNDTSIIPNYDPLVPEERSCVKEGSSMPSASVPEFKRVCFLQSWGSVLCAGVMIMSILILKI